jgi:alkylation response protein AidB-like acyl-CoA dehydrogenase
MLEALLATVERFGRARLDARATDRAARISDGVLAALADLGIFGLTIPEEHGGAGLDLAAAAEVVRALARHDRAVATTVGLHLGLGTRGLVAFAAPGLAARFLPDLASGKAIAAFGATEAGAGSDLAAIAATATPAGDRLRLSGSKIFVTNARLARVFTFALATPGLGGARRGQSLVVVDRADGLAFGAEEDKLGLRGSSTATVHLDGVEVPVARLLGTPGRAASVELPHVLSWGRTLLSAGCAGAAEAALALVAAHVTTRRQFGRPLAALEVVREQVATLAALGRATVALAAAAARAAGDPALLLRRSMAAKVFCSEADGEICDLALQLHGGTGFIEDSGLPLLVRDARVTRIFEGANDVLCTHLGALEVTAPLPADPAHELAARVAARRDELLARHGVKLLARARLLHRLGRLVVLREAAGAVAGLPGADAAAFLELALARSRPLLDEPLSGAALAAGDALLGSAP